MDNIILALQTKLKTALSTTNVFYGDDIPQKTQMPFISIEPVSTEYSPNGTGGLASNVSTIIITAKVRLNEYMSDTIGDKQKHLQALVNIMEERNTNGTPKSSTILGAISEDLSLSGEVDTISIGTIRYDTTVQDGSYIRTATLTIEAVQQLPLCTS
jgi:hypothetical protein